MAQARGANIIQFIPATMVEDFKKLGAAARAVGIAAIMDIAKEGVRIYNAGIVGNSLGLRPLAESTLLVRRRGKQTGVTPSRPASASINPLLYSGTSKDSLQVTRTGPTSVEMSFNPSATINYSRANVARNAALHERGGRTKGTYTKKQLAFLHIMFRRPGARGGSDREASQRKSTGKKRVGTRYTRKIPSRPAIQRTVTHMRVFTATRLGVADKKLQQLTNLRITRR